MSAPLNSVQAAAALRVATSTFRRMVNEGRITPAEGSPGQRGHLFDPSYIASLREQGMADPRRIEMLDISAFARKQVTKALRLPDPDTFGPITYRGLRIDIRASRWRSNVYGRCFVFQTRKGNVRGGFRPMDSDLVVCVGVSQNRTAFWVFRTTDVSALIGINVSPVSANWENRLTKRQLAGEIARLRDIGAIPQEKPR